MDDFFVFYLFRKKTSQLITLMYVASMDAAFIVFGDDPIQIVNVSCNYSFLGFDEFGSYSVSDIFCTNSFTLGSYSRLIYRRAPCKSWE